MGKEIVLWHCVIVLGTMDIVVVESNTFCYTSAFSYYEIKVGSVPLPFYLSIKRYALEKGVLSLFIGDRCLKAVGGLVSGIWSGVVVGGLYLELYLVLSVIGNWICIYAGDSLNGLLKKKLDFGRAAHQRFIFRSRGNLSV